MLIDILKEALKLFKKNLNLAQLIFIFFIISTIFLPIILGTKLNIKIIPVAILFFAFVCTYASGLFYAFKKACDYETTPSENPDPYGLPPLYFSEFFQGVGKYFVKFLLAGVLIFALFLLFGFGYDFIINHYCIIPDSFKNINLAETLSDNSKIQNFVYGLSEYERLKILKLASLTFVLTVIYGFSTILYPVILVKKEDNFLKSFIISIKYLFKNIFVVFAIFVVFNIALMLTSLLGSVNNIVIAVIAIILQCYINVLYILSLFLYYEKVK